MAYSDPHFNNVSVFLPLKTPSGTTPCLYDFSPRPKWSRTWTGVGALEYAAASYSASSPFSDGIGSIVFSTTGYLRVPVNSDPDFQLGTGDFTIEFWLYTADTNASIIDYYTAASGGYKITISSLSKIVYQAGSSTTVTSTNAVASNTWTHVAVVRYNGTTTIYLNGVNNGSVADTYDINMFQTNWTIARQEDNYSSVYDLSGTMLDVRLTKGIARYTSNFSVPTSRIVVDLVNDSYYNNVSLQVMGGSISADPTVYNYISKPEITMDWSPRRKSLTTASGGNFGTYGTTFGTTNYTCIPYYALYGVSANSGIVFNDSFDFAFGTGDFTIEFWVRPGATQGGKVTSTAPGIVFQTDYTTGKGDGITIYFTESSTPNSTVSVREKTYNSGTVLMTSSATVTNSVNNHVALTRTGGTLRLFINGVLDTSVANTTSYTAPECRLLHGWNPVSSAAAYAHGWYSGIRVTKGVARYTSTFTPYAARPYDPSLLWGNYFTQYSTLSINTRLSFLTLLPTSSNNQKVSSSWKTGLLPGMNYSIRKPYFSINQSNSTKKIPIDYHGRSFPTWLTYTTFADIKDVDVNGNLTGTVSYNSIPVANTKVSLFYRPTGGLIGSTLSDSVGHFDFKYRYGLDKNTNNYYIIAYSNNLAYGSAIVDRFTPES